MLKIEMRIFLSDEKSRIKIDRNYLYPLNNYLIRRRLLNWLTQRADHFVCNNLLQRYPDNVRYSEETRLRSVSKSFLAAAYPRFESPDTSKDPKRRERAHARARVFREQILPAISPLALLGPCSSTRCASVKSHRHASSCICVHHFVYAKTSLRCSFLVIIQSERIRRSSSCLWRVSTL